MQRPFWMLALLSLSGTPALAQRPPPTGTVAVVDTLFGTPVRDPYRWLEALDSPEVRAWFRAQAAYARAGLDALPGHAAILERLRQLEDAAPPDVSLPYEVDGRWFYTMRRPGDALARGYVRNARTGEERVVVDPAAIDGADRTGASRLVTFVPSPDGRKVLYGITAGGSERVALRVRDVASGRDIEGPVDNRFEGTAWWDPGGAAFYYWRPGRPPGDTPPDAASAAFDVHLARHRLGTDPGSDAVILESWSIVEVHPGDTLVLGREVAAHTAWLGAAAADVADGSPAWRPLFALEDSVAAVLPHGSDLYVLTHRGTPRVVRTPRDAPDLDAAETLMTGDAGTTLQYMRGARDGIYVQWFSDGVNRLTRIPWDGRPEPVELPPGTSIAEARAASFASDVRTDPRRSGALLTLLGWTSGPRHFRFDPDARRLQELPLYPPGSLDQLTGYVAETLLAPGHDGVLVPLTLVRPESTPRDGSLPVVLDVYAAYGSTVFRGLSPGPWFDMGGAWATCHARGGGYHGEAWHHAGRGASKPNSWLDLIACAEHLVREGYTRPGRLVTGGGSAGGIAVGRAITERPDLFAGAFISNGVLDAVRNATTPVGRANADEFGSLETEDGFRALLAMSPYHHVRPGTPYPAVTLWTGLEDIRVPAWESAKMAAALQAATSSGRPVLLRVQRAGGHASGALPAEEARLRVADTLAFWMAAAGLPPYRPPEPDE